MRRPFVVDWNAVSGITQIMGKPDPMNAPRAYSPSTRALNTAFQVSATRDARVSYPVDITVNSLLITGQQGTVSLQYADNSAMSTNLVTVASGTNSTGGVLSVTNIGTVLLVGDIPAGKWVRILTANNVGTPGFTPRQGQEVLL